MGRKVVNGKLLCTRCRERLPLSEFHKKNGNPPLNLSNRCKECAREIQWEIKYGITRTDYFAMLEKQGGVCAICKGDEPTYSHFCVDHNHKTGKVRALLCNPCNKLIGCAREDIRILTAAIAFLEEHS